MTSGDEGWHAVCSLSGGPQFQFVIVARASAEFTYVQGQFDAPIVDFFDKQ